MAPPMAITGDAMEFSNKFNIVSRTLFTGSEIITLVVEAIVLPSLRIISYLITI